MVQFPYTTFIIVVVLWCSRAEFVAILSVKDSQVFVAKYVATSDKNLHAPYPFSTAKSLFE
jgi:hypothetical protein